MLKIDNLLKENIENKKLYVYDGIKFMVNRVKNDYNGNPMYHIQVFSMNDDNITSQFKGLGRYYKSKEFISIQSYNINRTLEVIINGRGDLL